MKFHSFHPRNPWLLFLRGPFTPWSSFPAVVQAIRVIRTIRLIRGCSFPMVALSLWLLFPYGCSFPAVLLPRGRSGHSRNPYNPFNPWSFYPVGLFCSSCRPCRVGQGLAGKGTCRDIKKSGYHFHKQLPEKNKL